MIEGAGVCVANIRRNIEILIALFATGYGLRSWCQPTYEELGPASPWL